MARKTKTVVITDDGRDKGKTFIITELGATQAERWAIRATLALTNAGAVLPDPKEAGGMQALAVAGLQALANLSFDVAEPLLDEMMECVKYQPPVPNAPPQPIFSGDAEQIEEVATRFKLRLAVLELHTGFSLADARPKST